MELLEIASRLPILASLSPDRFREAPLDAVFLVALTGAGAWAATRAAAWLRGSMARGPQAGGPGAPPGGPVMRREAERLARRGDGHQAGHLFELVGDPERAAEQYERVQAYADAAAARQRARQWSRAAALYERAGDPVRAAECLVEGRDFRRAADLFRKAGRDLRAAEALEQGRQFGEAAALYEAVGRQEKAAALYERAGDPGAAAEALEHHLRSHLLPAGGPGRVMGGATGDATVSLRHCAELYRLAGRPDRAARILLQGGAEAEAAQLFLEAGDPRKALELFRSAGCFDDALAVCRLLGAEDEAHAIRAEQLSQAGATREAAEAWERAGDPVRAAEAYREAGEWERAAELFERLGVRDAAGELFEAAGHWARGGAAYAAAGRCADAARCFQRAGMVMEAAAAMADAGDPCGAGALLAEAGRAEEAIALLQKIPADSPHAAPAGLLLGRLLLAQGLPQSARHRLEALLGHPGLAGRHVELHYLLGRAHEALGRAHEALEHYDRLVAGQPKYEDASARAAALRERLRRPPPEADTTVVLRGRPGIPSLYRVIREVGRGGMGIVYEAHHQVLRRRVALKVPAPAIQGCPAARERFLAEARIAAGLRHPNIVTVYDAGEAHGGLYIAMDFVEGVTLEAFLRQRGRLGHGALLPLARQMCAGLAHAHERGVVHADVKPANMILDAAGTLYLTDFGLARAWGADASTTAARGTPAYIAPEQIRGEPLDARTDVYGLGCTLYRMLAGAPPFVTGDIFHAHLHEDPPSLLEANPDIPWALQDVVFRCLAKRPTARFESMAKVLEALEETLGLVPTLPLPIPEEAGAPALAR